MKKLFACFLLLTLLCAPLVSCEEEKDYSEVVQHSDDGRIFMLDEESNSYMLCDIGPDVSGEVTVDFFNGLPVTVIGEDAFRDRSSITSVVLGSRVTTIGMFAFNGCSNLTEIKGGEGLTYIGSYAFGHCTSLESFTVPRNTRYIGDLCFMGCTNLKDLSLPETIRHVGNNILDDCPNFPFTIYGNAKYMACGDNPYYFLYRAVDKEITSLSVHNDTRMIVDSAFYLCRALATADLGTGVRIIDEHAFQGCSALSVITIPQSTRILGYAAFRECTALSNVVLSGELQNIGELAFYDCPNLVTFRYRDGKYLGSSTNQYFCLIEVASTDITAAEIHESTKIICGSVFSDCEKLSKVTIPDGVTAISDESFSNCSKLKSITIPNSVKSIGENAFAYCDSLDVIIFEGTMAEWNAMTHYGSYSNVDSIKCTDGKIEP